MTTFAICNSDNNKWDDINFCSNCGMKIEKIEINIAGIKKEIRKTCKCKTKKNKKDLQEIKDREEQNKLHYLFKLSRLGTRFENSKFENIKITKTNEKIITEMKKLCNNFTEYKNNSYLLFSKPGTGKTLIVSSVANELMNKHFISTVFYVIPDLIADIRSTWKPGSTRTEEGLFDGLRKCSVLILDDLGAEYHKGNDDHAEEVIFRLINDRYRHMKCTIYTSNLDLNGIKSKVGGRTFSRILEMTGKNNIFNMENEINFRIEKFMNGKK